MAEEINFPNVVMYAIPGFIIAILIEVALWKSGMRGSRKKGLRFEARDTAASLAMGLGNSVFGAIIGGAVAAVYYAVYEFRFMTLPVHSGIVIAVTVFADDFFYYWFHRIAHERRWFWASHVIHHSSQHYNLSTALRQTWTGNLTFSFIFSLPLPLFGIHPALAFFISGINLVYQFWIHTEAIDRFPRWFEAVMNTPSHHRVHHATNPKYLDSNYAGMFIIWDKMFGTFVEEDRNEAPEYGIVKNLGTFNPLKIATHEWVGMAKDVAGAKSLGEAWGYIWGPPGWSPDGSRRTSAMIKADWADHLARQQAAQVEEAQKVPAE